MQMVEIFELLKTTGYPVAYHHFKSPPSIPFITYVDNGTSNFMADDSVFGKINNIDVELYTDKKDVAAEKKLEDLFEENGIAWEAFEEWIESEKMYQRIYEIGVR